MFMPLHGDQYGHVGSYSSCKHAKTLTAKYLPYETSPNPNTMTEQKFLKGNVHNSKIQLQQCTKN